MFSVSCIEFCFPSLLLLNPTNIMGRVAGLIEGCWPPTVRAHPQRACSAALWPASQLRAVLCLTLHCQASSPSPAQVACSKSPLGDAMRPCRGPTLACFYISHYFLLSTLRRILCLALAFFFFLARLVAFFYSFIPLVNL